ncbi:Protein N-acetyltransferase, RimJ/RimL family [Cribrihabitans marinus]|uniref:Protein N-acetyltransferase, RimJ/RimL family n=1 Tax=Cribrihabitans marinus TaxID=1227549 RepID=A0A1H6QIG4_9RHOB|nr:GNAT family N-acetyltransferase [Cribrihabitans marinus]GGH19006.1 hypothetical protein GCM10010973_02160 [Cribrihabitans marinus]SEI43501.1 Protein N-acetyltransferase, RimJ/RimL family [Cribrihabitans marinus]
MPEQLATERLLLRRLRADDAPALHAVFSDALAMQYFGDRHETLQQTVDWVSGSVDAPDSRCREYAIVLEGCVIGKAGVWNAPEIGFFLLRDHWGRGYMREALVRLLPRFFEMMDLDEITADVDPRNAASLALLHKLGFAETHRASATIRIGGEWCDSVFLRLGRDQAVSGPASTST